MKVNNGWGRPWKLDSHEPWINGILYGMDTETTSADPKTARIVSSAIVLDDPNVNDLSCWEWLSNPEIEIELEATAIHGISTEAARIKGADPEKVIREMLAHLESMNRPLVMVNAPFDLTILRQEMIRLGIGKLEDVRMPPIIDTLTCDRKLDPYRRGRRTLTATAAAYGIAIKGAHTAPGDIQCSIRLVRAMTRRYPWFGSCDLAELQKVQADAHDEWCANYETYQRLDDEEFIVSRGWPYQIFN